MANDRITNKERNLIKGSLRRVFSRSELRKQALELTIIDYKDPKRPRVKKWSQCASCKQPVPTYLINIDHIKPVVPIDKAFVDMSLDDVVDAIWSDKNNLQGLCDSCHNVKTGLENKARRAYKKGNKK